MWQEVEFTKNTEYIPQQVLEQDIDGTQLAAIGAIEHESDLLEGIPGLLSHAFGSEANTAGQQGRWIYYTRLHILTHFMYSCYTLFNLFTHCYTLLHNFTLLPGPFSSCNNFTISLLPW